MQVFSFFNTLWNYSDDIVPPSLLSPIRHRQRSCHLHLWWLCLWSFSKDSLSCLEIMTGSFHPYEATNLETIDNWGIPPLSEVWNIWSHGKDTWIYFSGFWEVEQFNRCFQLLGISDNFFLFYIFKILVITAFWGRFTSYFKLILVKLLDDKCAV